MRKIIASGALALAAALSTTQATAFTLGDHFTLRAYTGQAVGLALGEHLNVQRLGVVTNDTSICSALSGAVAGEFVAHNRKDDAVRTVAFGDAENVKDQIEPLLDQQAIALLFGGQYSPEKNAELLKPTLAALAEADYQGPILFHLAIWVTDVVEKVAKQDKDIEKWLAGKDNLMALTVDTKKGKALVHQVAVTKGKQRSTGIALEVPMEQHWLDLFVDSLSDR
ncbi:MAG TPA: hypothetical protein ENM98_02730 [Halothiobacillaceae bacterium]|nr:hypothetical protein [Halothiobacillaceae bacterium]